MEKDSRGDYVINIYPGNLERDIKAAMRESIAKQTPMTSYIVDKLTLETILLDKETSMDTFINNLIKKLMD